MIVEWDNAWEILTPAGTLPLNQPVALGTTPLGYYILDRTRCSAGAARRITRTNLPQADGEITHRKFKAGYVVELNVQLWETPSVPACGGRLRAMADLLDLHLNAIENDDGRIEWEPSSFPDNGPVLGMRMLDRIRSLGPSGAGADSGFVSVVVEHDPDGPLVSATFALLSPLPYAMDAAQTVTHMTGGTTTTIVQGGNTLFYPVMQIHGPATSFAITNESVTDEFGNPLSLVYDSTLPGAVTIPAGHYAEVDFFRQTIYQDGHFANLKAGIDVTLSDFFPLAPGANALQLGAYSGTGVDVLWQNAYV